MIPILIFAIPFVLAVAGLGFVVAFQKPLRVHSSWLPPFGHAALDLPCLANEAPTELPKDNNDRLLPFSNMAVSQQGGGKKNSGEPAQHSSVNYLRAAHSKKTLDAHLQIWNSHHQR